MRCGWTCLVEYPFTDGTGAKVRPVLIVSIDDFNRGDDVVVVPISSRPDESDAHSVYIDDASPVFSKTGLRCSSAAKWTKPFTISKSLVIRKLGFLDESLFSNVRASLLTLFSSSGS